MYDVIIVGGGPAGCRTAELIGKKGFSVLIVEEHPKIGRPVQCAGLVSWRIRKMLPDFPEEIILNEIYTAKFYSGSAYLELKSSKPLYVIDREKLDLELAERAESTGVEIKLSTKFRYFKRGKHLVVYSTRGKFETKILIGADGPNSSVAKQADIKQPENILVGMQTTVDGRFDADAVELWFNIVPDFFGWVIPINEKRARVGLGTRKMCKHHFIKFLKTRVGKISRANVNGLIRYGLIEDTVADNILLVGDAACQVKPFSGGGIIYCLIGARFAAVACIKALRRNEFTYEFFKRNYDKKWKSMLSGPIKKGIMLKKLMEIFPSISIRCASLFKPFISRWDVDFL